MTTEVYLHLGGEPSQLIVIACLHQKGRFRQIVLRGYGLEYGIVYPGVQKADPFRIPRKDLICEGLDMIKPDVHFSFSPFTIKSSLSLFRLPRWSGSPTGRRGRRPASGATACSPAVQEFHRAT